MENPSPPEPHSHRAPELVAAAAAVTLGVAVAVVAAGFPELPGGYPGPGLFPMIIGGLLAAVGLILGINGWRGRGFVPADARQGFDSERIGWALSNIAFVLVGAITVMVLDALVGFLLAMVVVMTALMLKLGRRLRSAVPAAIAGSVFVWYTFGTVLRVPLTPGPWGW